MAETPTEGDTKLLEHPQPVSAELLTILTTKIMPFSCDLCPLAMQPVVLNVLSSLSLFPLAEEANFLVLQESTEQRGQPQSTQRHGKEEAFLCWETRLWCHWFCFTFGNCSFGVSRHWEMMVDTSLAEEAVSPCSASAEERLEEKRLLVLLPADSAGHSVHRHTRRHPVSWQGQDQRL